MRRRCGWMRRGSRRWRCSAAAMSAMRSAQVLAPLPFALTWIDSRDGVFPDSVPPRVACEHSEPVQARRAGLAPQSRVLIMSFSHAEDLDIVAACLKRQREQRRPALYRPDRQQDQMGDLQAPAGGTGAYGG